MTGSSRKDGSIVNPGTRADSAPAEKDVLAPRAIREFILGVPLRFKTKRVQPVTVYFKKSYLDDNNLPHPEMAPYLAKDATPSNSSCLPGPRMAAAPMTPLTTGLPSQPMRPV